MTRALILLALGIFFVTPSQANAPVKTVTGQAKSDCQAMNGGKFDAKDAIQNVDLTGNGKADTIIDTSRFSCTSSRSLYCGSGGCTVHAVVGEKVWKFQAEGWQIVKWNDRPILLIARDGGWCGGSGAELCYEAVSWSNGRMMTVMPTPK